MPNVVWSPQPRQSAFMARPEWEALYGGAAGGGKSDALVIEALRQVHIPHYKALILRKTFPQLAELIDKSMDNCLDDISKAAGVPYENVINLFNATYRQTCIAALGKYQGEYEALKMTTDPEKYSKDYYDLLYKALQGDRAAYEAIYEDMVGSGTFAAEKVQNAMEKRMKAAQGVEKASELERRYLSPAQETAYDKVLGEVAQTDVWRSASAEQRGKAEDILYDLTVENSTGTKLREKIAGGAAHGIDEADYILFRLALEVVDQPTESGKLGSYTNDEVEEAIGMLDGLTDAERSYLWTMQGKSDKSNPWG